MRTFAILVPFVVAAPSGEAHKHSHANLTEARAAAEDAVGKVEFFRKEVEKSANYTLVSTEMVEKAAKHAIAPYIERRNHLLSRMKELRRSNASHRDLEYKRSELERALDEVSRQQEHAVDKRMRHMEESARHESRKDIKKIEHMAREARSQIDALFSLDKNGSVGEARTLQDRVDGAVDKAQEFADDFARIVEKSERARLRLTVSGHQEAATAAQPVDELLLAEELSDEEKAEAATQPAPVSLDALPGVFMDALGDPEGRGAVHAVHQLTRFRHTVENRAANTTVIDDKVENAAVKAEAPYIDKRSNLMVRLAKLAKATRESKMKGMEALAQLHHDFDAVDREQRRALRASMDAVEDEARHEGRKDEERAEELARDASDMIDRLARSSARPAERHARAMQDHVDRDVEATRDLSEKLQRHVEKRARQHVDYLDYTDEAFKEKLDRAATLLQQISMAEEQHVQVPPAAVFPSVGCFVVSAVAIFAFSVARRARVSSKENWRTPLLQA
jgi:hypothetical protein